MKIQYIATEDFLRIVEILNPNFVILEGYSIYFESDTNKLSKKENCKFKLDYKPFKDCGIFYPTPDTKFKFSVVRFIHPS